MRLLVGDRRPSGRPGGGGRRRRTQPADVDLAELSLCDSAGLDVLIHARRIVAEHGRHLILRARQRQFLRLLTLAGTYSLFAITDT
ncbi:STAS domain-containing protein [Streptomyces sp. NPDC059193]|uniref:STAS domain-containing protein n=1 Tax=Streptomyces sp. NPDC059193 TaxID=3346763 RepID=UPI0036C16722